MATLYGDTTGTLRGRQHGDDQTLQGDGLTDNLLVGDARRMVDRSHGGDDTITGGTHDAIANQIHNVIFGDAERVMRDYTRGGDDVLTGGTPGHPGLIDNDIYGDTFRMTGHARGGNDKIFGGHDTNSTLFGDADTLSGHARGGDDTITSGSVTFVSTILYGDGRVLHNDARGGDDILIAGDEAFFRGSNTLYGDAEIMDGHSRGGDDVLYSAGGARNELWGDARETTDHVITGRDTFVLEPGHNGTIGDFEHGKDQIDLTAFADIGVHSFKDLTITELPTGGVHFHDAAAFTVFGVDTLSAKDFFFA
jgi:hypothetical protein